LGAGNQQERLSTIEAKRWFLAGIIEGEGSLCVSIKEHKASKYGFFVDPEFYIYQHKKGISILKMAKEIFGTGRIYSKPGNENVMVFAITCRRSLKEKVIPFLEKYMIFSSKREEIRRFKEIVDALESKEHLRPEGMIRIVEKAYAMNSAGKGKKRGKSLKEIVERILRDHTPDTPKK
jgi:hypothetical protein